MATVQIAADSLPQRWDAIGGRIAMMPIAQCLDPGIDDMGRRGEVRLADPQIDHIRALGRQGIGFCQNIKGGFGAKTAHSGSKGQHGRLFHERMMTVCAKP